MAITEEEKVNARHHMGYLNVQSAQTFSLGVPAAVQTQFMIEGALNKILPQAETRFRNLLQKLDEVECQVVENTELAAVDAVDEIKIRPDSLKELSKYYKIWQHELGNLLGVPPNPFDFRTWLSSDNINVPVQH